MDKILDINLSNNVKNNDIYLDNQKTFLNTTFGNLVNQGINFGLKKILPDFIEDQIIEIKDSILEEGFSEGLNKTINTAIDLGKSAIGIFTGNFENVSQIKTAIKKGGLIDSISKGIDWGINKITEKNLINKNISSIIKKGKNIILDNVNNNIENSLISQTESIEKINKYVDNWNKFYKAEDFENMEKQYEKIVKELKKVVPIENVLKEARKIENMQNLIKNNGKNFKISEEEKELANKLI